MKKILIINGPNLNLLGRRQPEIYGKRTFGDILADLRDMHPRCEIEYFQSNSEGALIDKLHEVGYNQDFSGIVLNAGAYTHTSLALADAIAAIELPVIEVHLSNIAAREPIRRTSLIAPVCCGSIVGFGEKSYALAIEALLTC